MLPEEQVLEAVFRVLASESEVFWKTPSEVRETCERVISLSFNPKFTSMEGFFVPGANCGWCGAATSKLQGCVQGHRFCVDCFGELEVGGYVSRVTKEVGE